MLSLQLHYYMFISRLIIYLSVFNIKRFVNLYIHHGQINSSKLAQLYCKKLSIPSILMCVTYALTYMSYPIKTLILSLLS